ncbi:ferroxidase fet3 [Coemansia sp. Benny D115]|nr:ferroxidase fet3 [Coemansia sp. Benny D115]
MSRSHLVIIFALLLCGIIAQAARVEVRWNVTYVQIDRDGYSMRRAIGVNGQIPIPPVHASVGDTLVLHVHNSLDKPTSIHAHGLVQNNTNYLDGATMFTQCGIPPGQSFTYEHYLHQPGTFWLHGHFNHQNADGLRTPLVVYDRERPPYKYDEDHLFYFEDWYQVEYAERLKITIGPSDVFPPPATYPTAMINGFDGNKTKPLEFKPGKTYRLRFVNMATTEWFKFNIPGHKLQVIEADGVYSTPLTVDGLDLSPGQRYSVLVTAQDTDKYNYNYNVTLYASFLPNIKGFNPRYYQGLVEYRKGASVKETKEPKDFVWAHDINLSALSGEKPLDVDRSITLTVGATQYLNGEFHDVINNITYAPPVIPSLYSALSMGKLATNESLYGPQTHAVVLKYMDNIELVIRNPNTLAHPLHLHGHSFQIVEYGPVDVPKPVSGTDSPTADIPPIPVTKFTGSAPMIRDTMLIPEGQYIKLRFKADNPGAWALHCHMDIHFGLGMAMTFIEAPDVLQSGLFKIPEKMLEHCKMLGIPVTGNGAGREGFDLAGLSMPLTRNQATVARDP